MPLVPPDGAPIEWGPIEPVAFDTGCALGCATELTAGQVIVPFGDRADRGARQRMSEAEQALVSQGLPLDRGGTGVAARFAPAPRWTVDTALVLSGGRDLARVAERGPRPPDLAARAGFDAGLLTVGGSVWLSGLDDRAVALDLAVDAGHWTLATELARQWIGDVKRAFDEDLAAREVRGDGASVRLERAFGPRWTAGAALEGRVFVARDRVALAPWVRSVAGVEYALRRRVRWTVLEVAEATALGPAADDLRLSTRIELGRARR